MPSHADPPLLYEVADEADGECNTVLTIDQGDDHWVIRCTQDAGHVSPHASHIVWPNDGAMNASM